MITGYKAVVLVPPQQEPVTLAQVKSHCRIIIDEDDSYLTDLIIPAARDRAEKYLRRYLCEQIIRVTYDMFAGNQQYDTYAYGPTSTGILTIPVGPVRSIQLVSYRDDQDESQVLATTEYSYDLDNEPARVYPAFQKYWPSISGQPAAISIDLTVGYLPGNQGSPTDFAANIPPAIKQAILLDCGHLYEHRETISDQASMTETPQGWDALLWPYRLLT